VYVLWRTDEMRQQKPTVLEEIQAGLDYFRYSLFDAVCTTYRYAENSLGVSALNPEPRFSGAHASICVEESAPAHNDWGGLLLCNLDLFNGFAGGFL
jgi:hypothetical protein